MALRLKSPLVTEILEATFSGVLNAGWLVTVRKIGGRDGVTSTTRWPEHVTRMGNLKYTVFIGKYES